MSASTSLRGAASRAARLARRIARKARFRREPQRPDPGQEAYREIRENLGRPDLDPTTLRRIDEYATEVLGGVWFAPWLRAYTLFRGQFLEGWIPRNFYSRKVLPGLTGGRNFLDGRRTVARKFLDGRRTVARKFLATDLFPDLAYRINDRWFDADYRPIPLERLTDAVFAEHPEVYVKEEGLWQGLAVQRVGRDGFDAAVGALGGDAVIQAPVRQHPFFDEIHPDSVATLRIVTSFLDSAGPRFHGCRLRLATGGDRWVKSQSQIAVSIIDDDGTFADEGQDKHWRSFPRHPDTGFPFAGSRIPHFREAVDACRAFHRDLPHQFILGWDLAVTPNGVPAVLEVNSGEIGIIHFEATIGPIFLGCGFERFA